MRLALVWFACGVALAWGDGGTVRVQDRAGAFVVTVFTSPQPLVAGTVDVSVLVQDAAAAPVLDAAVAVQLTPPEGGPAHAAAATHAAADNKLLYAALMEVPRAGRWVLDVTVARAADTVHVTTALPVEPVPPPLRALWPYLVLPGAAMLVFAVHQALAAGRRGVDRRGLLAEDARAGLGAWEEHDDG